MSGLGLLTTERIRRPATSSSRFGLRFWLTTGGVAVVVAASVLAVSHFARRADLLKLSVVRVEGVDLAIAREVEAYAQVAPGTPLLAIDLDEVARRAEEHPFVRSATVRRVPPSTLVVEVVPREAVMLVSLGSLYLADGEGVVFKRAVPGDGLDLPVVTGIGQEDLDQRKAETLGLALDALLAHGVAGNPGGPVQEIHVEPGVGITLHLAETRVRLGTGDFDARLARLPEVLSRFGQAGRVPAEVFLNDHRRPERVAVRLRGGPEMAAHGEQQNP